MDITVLTVIMWKDEDEYFPHRIIGLNKQYNTAGNQTMQSPVLTKQIHARFLSLAISGLHVPICYFVNIFIAVWCRPTLPNLFLLTEHVGRWGELVRAGWSLHYPKCI